jgi:hypothetical protein
MPRQQVRLGLFSKRARGDKMQEWEIALNQFLKEWKVRNEVIGAMVCGSYITGSPSKRSDIDVHIILSDDVDWRERGNKISNGYLIEYFANPPKQIRGYFQEDYHDHNTMSMVQFITGKTLFDNNGVIHELKVEAADLINNRQDELDEAEVELKKYTIWDDMDNLKDCFEQQRADFNFTYHNSLFRLVTAYCTFLKLENVPYYQIHSYLSKSAYLHKYLKQSFPDEQFKQIFISAIQEVDRNNMMERYEQLSQHVLDQMGGFDIDGWKLRSPIDFFL